MIVDDNDDLLCLMCNELFDDQGNKLPRMLPECGHSVCTQCLTNKLDTNEPIICPEDQEQQNRTELTHFPKNFSLIRMIQKKKKIQSQMKQQTGLMSSTTIHTDNDRYSDVNYTPRAHVHSEESDRNSNVHISAFEDKTCTEHFKKLDIVCVDCRIKICANCALFGKHKGHIVRSEEDVLKEISARAEYLLQMFETIEKKQCYLTDESHILTVKEYLQSNLKNVLQEIQNKFTEIENKLRQKKEDSIKIVQERFTEMETKCIHFLTEAPKDAIDLTEKWKIEAKQKLLVLCEQNNSDHYSLDLMLDQRLENSNDIIHQGQELLKCIEQANLNLEKQLEEFQFETVYVDFAHNYKTQFDKLISVSSRQDNELSNLLHTKKNILFQKPFTQSELSLARQSIDVFHEKIDRKTSDKENYELRIFEGGDVSQRISIGGEMLDSPFQKNKYRTQSISNGYGGIHNNHMNNISINSHINNENGQIHSNQSHFRNGQNYMNGQASQNSSAQQNNIIQYSNSNTISMRKHTPSIFNNDPFDDNLLNNDDLNEQFNDSVLMMTKQSSKFNSPAFFNKVNVEEFVVPNNMGKGSSLSEPQLLEGIEQELFGKNIELPNNIDVQIKQNPEHHHNSQNHFDHHDLNSSRPSNNSDNSLPNKSQNEGIIKDNNKNNELQNSSKKILSNLNEKFNTILQDIQKDKIESADFTYADMGDEGIQGLCESMRQNKMLKSLKLQRNKISDKGACQLIDLIIDNQSNIGILYLQDNMISDKFLDYLLQKCSKLNNNNTHTKQLEQIYLKNNLLNVNKSQKVLEELKKMQITIHL